MTSGPACATPETPLQDVARMMVDNDCGQIPVIDDVSSRRPVGVVTDRDIVCRVIAKGGAPAILTVREVMSSPAITVSPDMHVEDCCKLLEEKQVRRAPVQDGKGQCCGMVSLADIARSAPEKLTGQVVRTVSRRTAFASVREGGTMM